MTIQHTQDYSLFKHLRGNREYDMDHIKRLMRSLEADPAITQFQPVLVNEQMEVIDGQHRIEASRLLGLPVYFIIRKGASLTNAQKINVTTKTWTPRDWAQSYAALGEQAYKDYIAFQQEFPFTHTVILDLLTLGDGHKAGAHRQFREGSFLIADMPTSRRFAEQLTLLGTYYRGYRHASFARAYIRIAQHEAYDHTRFLKQMQEYAHELRSYGQMGEALRDIERVYNLNQQKKVRFF